MPISTAPPFCAGPNAESASVSGRSEDMRRLQRFASLGACSNCAGDLAVSDSGAGLVCARCPATWELRRGVVRTLPSGHPALRAPSIPTGTTGWASGITADMDSKSATYSVKYDQYTLASRGYIIRLRHALDMAGAAPGRVLEAGCGPGIVGPLLSERGLDVHGVDLSGGQLETAAARDDRTLYVQGDLERLPYKSGVFDTVILLGVLEYVERSQAVLAELARVMTEGGRIVVSVPNARGLPRLWTHYVYIPSARACKRLLGMPVSSYSRTLYSLGGLESVLAGVGLRAQHARFFDVSIAPSPLDRVAVPAVLECSDALEDRLGGHVRAALSNQIMVSATVGAARRPAPDHERALEPSPKGPRGGPAHDDRDDGLSG
jgi:SAM-dependent methyltransferase